MLTPVFVVLAFAAFQAAMWGHARTEARVIARDTAAMVARGGAAPADAVQSATAILAADTDLVGAVVSIVANTDVVAVTVEGRVPGLIRGTATDVSVTSAVPREGWTP